MQVLSDFARLLWAEPGQPDSVTCALALSAQARVVWVTLLKVISAQQKNEPDIWTCTSHSSCQGAPTLWVLIPCGLGAVTGLLAAGAGEVEGIALVVVVVLNSSELTTLLLVLECIGGPVRAMEVGKVEIASKIQSLSLVTRV